MNKIIIYFLFVIMAPALGHASSVIFNRDTLTIESYTTPPVTEEEPSPQRITRRYKFFITLRPAHDIQPGWFIDRTSISGRYGTLTMFERPSIAEISFANIVDAMDILFIDSHGYIRAIAKSVVLRELVEPLSIDTPIRGLLYLSGGTTDALGIRVGNRVIHKNFPKKPLVEDAN